MKILVATKETQGKRKSDFSHVEEGELIYFGSGPCDRDKDDIDGGCGCMRAVVGIKTGMATTTFKVVETDLRPSEVLALVKETYVKSGFGKYMTEKDYMDETGELIMLASKYKVGSVMEKRGNVIRVRKSGEIKVNDAVPGNGKYF